MSENPRPARAPSPGVILAKELEARGWSLRKLAEETGYPLDVVAALVDGTSRITPEVALHLARAFGTSAELWLNLDSAHREWLESRPG